MTDNQKVSEENFDLRLRKVSLEVDKPNDLQDTPRVENKIEFYKKIQVIRRQKKEKAKIEFYKRIQVARGQTKERGLKRFL